MTAVATTRKPRASGWSPARRRNHAKAIRRWKPWTRATGPKTPAGKAASAKNAFKHGNRADPFARYRRLLKDHSALLSNLVNCVRVVRRYNYYALPGCTASLQKLIILKDLDRHRKMTANELLDLAKRHGLMRFPKRWRGHIYADLDRVRRKCEKLRELLSPKG